jgi:pimeloyl-ACP methyl ester carboxylesterase
MIPRLAFALLIGLVAHAAFGEEPISPPVAVVVDGRLPIAGAQLPMFVSQDWSRPLPGVRRVVIVVHGYNRNAADYARNMMALRPPADTLVWAPQFLDPDDIAAHQLPDAVLRWDREQWLDGNPALGPTSLSAFDGFDAILAKLTDEANFPNLSQIVLAGFSAGGQVVQRYAEIGKGEDRVPLRFIVGSPSSYAYFGDERPEPDGTLGAFADTASCPNYNRWKYGFAGGLPPYARGTIGQGIPVIEHRYAARDIVYLAGGNDTDPNHRLLDKSCAGEAQGPTRLARMQAFVADMKRRNPGIQHPMWMVDGVAHNEARVFGSPCGRAALFGDETCSGN